MLIRRAVRTVRVSAPTHALFMLVGAILSLVGSSAQASEPLRISQPSGCESFEASLIQAPDPTSRLALADCYAQHGRSASAWSQYRETAVAAREIAAPELEAVARDRAKALEPELSYLTVTTWKGQDVMVTQDGSPIDSAVLGTAIPLDPGRHVIRASAPGKRSWSKPIELGSHGDHVTVSVPVLPDDVQLLHSELNASPAALPASLPDEIDEPSGSVQRSLGLIAGAIGIAGVATGTLFGVKAASDWSDAKALCQPYPYCGEEGARLASDAKESALISTIGFATGVLGLSSGALLWFTAESESRPRKTTELRVGAGSVTLRGAL